MTSKNNSDFFNKVTVSLASIAKCDIMQIDDLLERGQKLILTWLKDENLREHFKNDAMMYYYNIACIAFSAGVLYADAWDKDITQIKMGTVDTLLSAQPDLTGVAFDVLGVERDDENTRRIIDSMFERFLELMTPYWDKVDPRPFLFQGILAFLEIGISYRLRKNKY